MDWVVRKGLFEKVRFELRPEWMEEASQVKIWGESIPRRGNNRYKCPKCGKKLSVLQEQKER